MSSLTTTTHSGEQNQTLPSDFSLFDTMHMDMIESLKLRTWMDLKPTSPTVDPYECTKIEQNTSTYLLPTRFFIFV